MEGATTTSGGDPKQPSSTGLVQEHLETFLAQVELKTGMGEQHPPVRWHLEDHRRPFDRLRTRIEHSPVIARILTHLNLPARAPPRSPARLFYPQGAQQGHSLALAFDRLQVA